jgi:hypothetical protein
MDRRLMTEHRPGVSATLRTYVAVSIAVLWAAGYIVSILERDYGAVGAATPLALIAVGYLLGANFTERNGNGKAH